MEARSSIQLTDEDKKEVLLHTIEEAFRNIRFYYDVSYKASTWGSAAIAVFAVFLIDKKPVTQLWERIAVELALLAFGFALTTVIVRCNTVTRNYWNTVTQVDIAFDTFTPGVYISDESLFPSSAAPGCCFDYISCNSVYLARERPTPAGVP